MYNQNLVWVYVVSEPLGISCMAMFAAFPSTIMEAASGRLHNNGAGAFGARPIVVDSIVVGGDAKTSLGASGRRKHSDISKDRLAKTSPSPTDVQTDSHQDGLRFTQSWLPKVWAPSPPPPMFIAAS